MEFTKIFILKNRERINIIITNYMRINTYKYRFFFRFKNCFPDLNFAELKIEV